MTEAHPAHSTGGASRVGGGDLLPLVSGIDFWTSGGQSGSNPNAHQSESVPTGRHLVSKPNTDEMRVCRDQCGGITVDHLSPITACPR